MDFDEDEGEEKRCAGCKKGCTHLMTFILSHLGLLSLVVGYCVIGALTFQLLEVDGEKEVKRNMTRKRLGVSGKLWDMTEKVDYIDPETWIANATKILEDFEVELLDAMHKRGWDGKDSTEELNWTFTGSLFYSIIVITTIGYGNIAPKTMWGKIVTIFYAIIGIPLMVICWSHIGDFMANSFRVIYWKVCCFICTRRPPRHRSRSHLRRGKSVRGASSRGTSVRMKQRSDRSVRRSGRASQRSADSGASDAISTISEPGVIYGAHTRTYSSTLPRTTQPRSFHPVTPLPSQKRSTKSAEPEFGPGLPVLYNKYAEDIVPVGSNEARPQRITRNRSVPPEFIRPKEEEIDRWNEDFDDYDTSDYEDEDPSKRPVPIWLCSALVIGYIVGGTFLFREWEQWETLDSAYFCFITLTTIGFGDFVPKGDSERSIALCSVYLLFGIALLAMSFNLVQEQVINSVKELAITLGIIDDEEDR